MTFIIIWIVSAVLGAMIGGSKGRGGAGFALGFLIGPLGVLITLFLKPNNEKVEAEAITSGSARKCPFCAELVKAEAVVCKHCGKDLPAVEKAAAPEGVETWECKCGAYNETKYMVCQTCSASKP